MKYRNFLRPFIFVVVMLFSISGLLISSAQLNIPVNPPVTALPSVFDVRGPDGIPQGLGLRTRTPVQIAALTALEQQVGGALSVNYNGLTATPRHLFSHGRYLSSPSSAPPETVARDFIARWRDIFRFSDADLANLRLKSRGTVPDMGVTILLFEQSLSGLPVYKGEVLVNINRAGQVMSVGGDSFPVMSIINAAPITPEQFLSDAFTISEELAITRATAELGIAGFVPQRAGTQKVPRTFGSAPREYTVASKFDRGVFTDDIIVTKTVFPLGGQGRLAYKVTLTTPQYNGIMWENIVDAQTGAVLRRGSA
jgi:Zn-dependent metalloprotease